MAVYIFNHVLIMVSIYLGISYGYLHSFPSKLINPNHLNYRKDTDISKIRLSFTPLKIPDFDTISVSVYDSQLWFSHLVETQFTTISPLSLLLLFIAGLLTSFSPCAMSLIPITLAYLSDPSEENTGNRIKRAVLYAVGLATTLSCFGLAAAFLGQMYGTVAAGGVTALKDVPSILSSALALVMGLSLLEIIGIRFPSIDLGDFGSVPDSVRAFLLGGSAALISSDCSSPVLASLLAVVAASNNPTLGAALLFAYSMGYCTPVVVAGAMSNSFSVYLASQGAGWVNKALAAVLVGYGTYSGLDVVTRILNV